MRSSSLLCAALASAGFAATASAGTLLVDFNSNNNGGFSGTTASAFQANDAAVSLAATVNDVNADTFSSGAAVNFTTVTGLLNDGSTFNATLTIEEGSGFNAGSGANDGVEILDGYIFSGSNDGPQIRVTGLGGVIADPTSIVLTAYGIDDQSRTIQEYRFSFAATGVGGVGDGDVDFATNSSTPIQSIDFDNLPAGLTGNSVGAGAGGTLDTSGFVDGFTLIGVRNFGVLNGFSLTFDSVPEPSSLALFGLGGLLVASRRRG